MKYYKSVEEKVFNIYVREIHQGAKHPRQIEFLIKIFKCICLGLIAVLIKVRVLSGAPLQLLNNRELNRLKL